VLLRACGAGELSFAGGCERDEVASTVVGVALAGDQAVGLERVQQGDEDARIHAHQLDELALREAAVVVQQSEDLELPGFEVVCGVRGAQAAHRLLPEQREQQAGARAVLVEDAGGRGRRGVSWGRH